MAKKKAKKAKKTVKKKAPKSRKVKITIIMEAPKGKEFHLADGRKLKSLKDLAFAFGDMADDVFWHHVNHARNDFAHWVKTVFKDDELSDALRLGKDRLHAQLRILKHIVKKL